MHVAPQPSSHAEYSDIKRQISFSEWISPPQTHLAEATGTADVAEASSILVIINIFFFFYEPVTRNEEFLSLTAYFKNMGVTTRVIIGLVADSYNNQYCHRKGNHTPSNQRDIKCNHFRGRFKFSAK
jgi:hypothetical protein